MSPRSLTPKSHIPSSNTKASLPSVFRILSWNVNGITHLLPKSHAPITSFFPSSTSSSPLKKRKRQLSRIPSPELETESSTTRASRLRTFLKRYEYPEIVCLQEVKIKNGDEVMKRGLERAANTVDANEGWEREEGHFVRYKAHFSLPRDKHNATGFGGKVHGVCTLIRSDLLSYLSSSFPSNSSKSQNEKEDSSGIHMKEENGAVTKQVPWDLEGRVLVTELKSLRLVVVNGYWPNGTLNPWRDSKTGVVCGTRHDFKLLFHSQILDLVKQYQNSAWEVVLIGDMNIAPTPLDGYPGIRLGSDHVRNRADFNWRFLDGRNEEGMRGIDSWRWKEGERKGYTYHGEKKHEWGTRGDRVDLGVVSRGLTENGNMRLVGSKIWESVEERGGSDHVPIEVILEVGEVGRVDEAGTMENIRQKSNVRSEGE